MKPISELGLELIELEDQVLLVDENTKEGSLGFVHIGKMGTIGKVSYDLKYKTWDLTTSEGIHYPFSLKGSIKNIISSTKPLEGLPLLVVEDDVDENLRNRNFHKQVMNPYTVELYSYTVYEKGFVEGYNKSTEFHSKAKEIYKFTEEDLCEFVEWTNLHYRALEHTISFKGVEGTKQLLNLWLKEKREELWIEVEWEQYNEGDSFMPDLFRQIPKITNNQIKAVWK